MTSYSNILVVGKEYERSKSYAYVDRPQSPIYILSYSIQSTNPQHGHRSVACTHVHRIVLVSVHVESACE